MDRRIVSIASLAVALCAWIALGAGDRARGASVTSELVHMPDPTPASMVVRPAPEPRPTRQVWMEVTAYCPCTKCCGPKAQGITASGLPVTHNDGKFVAADTRLLPFGSKVTVPGYGNNAAVPVIDRGGAIKGHRLDVFYPTHQEALEWGRRWVMVTIEN